MRALAQIQFYFEGNTHARCWIVHLLDIAQEEEPLVCRTFLKNTGPCPIIVPLQNALLNFDLHRHFDLWKGRVDEVDYV